MRVKKISRVSLPLPISSESTEFKKKNPSKWKKYDREKPHSPRRIKIKESKESNQKKKQNQIYVFNPWDKVRINTKIYNIFGSSIA